MSQENISTSGLAFSEENKAALCEKYMTANKEMQSLLLKYYQPGDFMSLRQRSVGDGSIGGKACGLLAANKIIADNLPEYAQRITSPRSFFITTDVFSRYLEVNKCKELMEHFCNFSDDYEILDLLNRRLLKGKFPQDISDKLLELLKTLEYEPLIVRSSSIMEDSYENSYSGKYESIFLANQGTAQEMFPEFLDAIRRVFASMANPSAIAYRKKRGTADMYEQMALLVQPAVGMKIDHYYFPAVAGMGCSYNPYHWIESLNPHEGMLRIVMGYGTRAAERTPGDYPRLVGLGRPQAHFRTTIAERHKYSQHQVDVLDLETNAFTTQSLRTLLDLLPECYKKLALNRDKDAENTLAQRGIYKKVYFADCQGIVEKKEFITMIRKILTLLEREYQRPVDIEFAITCTPEGHWRFHLLQCRPLQVSVSEEIHFPQSTDKILFDVRRTSMLRSKTERIDYIVYIDPKNYYECPYKQKPDICQVIAQINSYFEGKKNNLLLLTPGRIGTSSPELGVPVTYAEISQFKAICEVAYSEVGYNPELSYGSHMFQDMVESDVYYGAIRENNSTRIYRPEILKDYPDFLPYITTTSELMQSMIKVYDVTGTDATLILDSEKGRAVCCLDFSEGHK